MAWVLRLPKEVQSNLNKFRCDGTPSALAMKWFSVENDEEGSISVRAYQGDHPCSRTTYIRQCSRCYAGWLQSPDRFLYRQYWRDYDAYLGMTHLESKRTPHNACPRGCPMLPPPSDHSIEEGWCLGAGR